MIRSTASIPALVAAMLACAMLPGPAAAQVYICTAGGKTSYGDLPCTEGRSTVLPPPAAGIRPEGAERMATSDSRTALELDKMELERERQAQRDQRRDDARAERAEARSAKAAAARRKQCERLRLRVKWANEDAARTHGKRRDAARVKARRAAETMAVECPA